MDKENGDESNASQYQTEYVGKFAVLMIVAQITEPMAWTANKIPTQSPAVWYCADCVSSTTLETPFVMVVMTGVSNTFKATVPLV